MKKVQKKPVAATAAEWSCPNDDNIHLWMHKGNAYFRNYQDHVYRKEADGSCGDWCGVYNRADGNIDDSVEEPDL